MKKSSAVWLVVIIVVIVAVAGYFIWVANPSSNNSGYAPVPTSTTSQTPTTTAGGPTGAPMIPLALNTASTSALGTFLVASNGMTLYRYTPDGNNVSNCTGQCAAIWPPYTVSATIAAGLAGGLGIGGTLATITRANGTLQVTYNGKPLYYYSKDSAPGDTKGQNVGGIWFVVAP